MQDYYYYNDLTCIINHLMYKLGKRVGKDPDPRDYVGWSDSKRYQILFDVLTMQTSEIPEEVKSLLMSIGCCGATLIDFCTGSGDALKGLIQLIDQSELVLDNFTFYAFDAGTTPYIDECGVSVIARKQRLHGTVDREWTTQKPSIGIISYADLYNSPNDFMQMIENAAKAVDILMIMPAEQSRQDTCLFIAKTESGLVDFVIRE